MSVARPKSPASRSLLPRALIVALAGGALLAVGCGGEASPGPNPNPPTNDPDMASPLAADMAQPAPAFDWTGTWIAAATYNVSCVFGGAGAPQRATETVSNALVISSTRSGLEAYANFAGSGYYLTGTGTANRLLLAGKYPVKDFQGNVIGSGTTDQNSITLSVDTLVGKSNASGTISGSFVGRFGHSCTIDSGGQISLSR